VVYILHNKCSSSTFTYLEYFAYFIKNGHVRGFVSLITLERTDSE
jgi:hypothetical protein